MGKEGVGAWECVGEEHPSVDRRLPTADCHSSTPIRTVQTREFLYIRSGYGNRILATSAYSHRWGGPEIRCPYAPIPPLSHAFSAFPRQSESTEPPSSDDPSTCNRPGARERLGVSAKGGQATPQKPARPRLPASPLAQRTTFNGSTYHVQRTTRHSATPASKSSFEGPAMPTHTLTSCCSL